MGWLIVALVALAVLGLAGIAAPAVFGPVFAGFAPVIFVVGLIGLGAAWWRHAGRRVDAETEADAPDDAGTSNDEPLRGEDDRVET